jgi:uncharacterized membrane protein
MPSSTPAATAPRQRLVFLDALRGFALIMMVLNHTARWWQDGPLMGWPRYYLIYVTMAVAAPTFLFLVGFCLPLSLARTRAEGPGQLLPTLWKYARRGGRIILAGLLLNGLVFMEDFWSIVWSNGVLPTISAIVNGTSTYPFWSNLLANGVLQTIGFSIIVAAPVVLFIGSSAARYALLALSGLIYLSFGWAYGPLSVWVGTHPTSARILFFEFPPWPWVAVVLFALVPGELWLEQPERRSRARYMWAMAGVGLLCIAWLFAYDWWAHTPDRFMFKRDFILNNHWTPRGATTVWVIGLSFCLMAIFYYLAEVKRLRMTWLVTFGQTALILYFVHQIIVLTLVNEYLDRRFNDWLRFGLANLALLVLLLGVARLWLEIKRIFRERLPSLGVFRRA